MPTSISVMRTPEAETGHDAPVSVEEPELAPLPVGKPPSPHDTGGAAPDPPEPLLDPLPLPLPLGAPPELPALPAPEPLPELPVLELPVLEPPLPELLPLVAP
jgi:hypothetical protein